MASDFTYGNLGDFEDKPLLRLVTNETGRLIRETATSMSEGAPPTTSAQVHDAFGMEDSTDPVASAPQYVSLEGVETKQQATLKIGDTSENTTRTKQNIDVLAEVILLHMKHVQTTMEALQSHITTQLDGPKEPPLHKWTPYTDYNTLSLAITSLNLAVTHLEPRQLPETQANRYHHRARSLSTATSKIAIFILGHANRKCSTCMEDLDAASDLDADAKQAAYTHMTGQVGHILDYCSRATSCIWTAFDTLEAHVQPMSSCEIAATGDTTARSTLAPVIKDEKCCVAEDENDKVTEPSLTYHNLIALAWLVVTVICVYPTVHSLFPTFSSSNNNNSPSQQQPICETDIYHQTLHLVERTNAITNLTTGFYTIQLADLDSRYKALEQASESHGLRIDNLVDTLGPPNEQGTYHVTGQIAEIEGLSQRLRRMQEDVEWRMQRMQNEMTQTRKTMHRVDIRLTKRLDKVGAGR